MSVFATSLIVVGVPLPTFTATSSASDSTASRFARAMSLTWMKSLVCSPSSKTSGELSFLMRLEKIAQTPV